MSALAVVPWIKNDSDLAPLHSHPRYQALLAREEARLAAAQAEQSNEAEWRIPSISQSLATILRVLGRLRRLHFPRHPFFDDLFVPAIRLMFRP